jgi:tetratricopeptide (TPR) repeat protein
MTQMIPTNSTTSIVTASMNDELSSLEAAIMDACNELHSARQTNGQAGVEIFTLTLQSLLDTYDATDGDNHPNPAWARANQRALANSAMGNIEKAIALELTALKYADTPRRREISSGNIADRFIRLGDPSSAIAFFLDAQEENPDSIPVLLTGAVAVYEAGYPKQAEVIFNTLLKNPDLLTLNSELTAYLDLDPRTRAVAESLDSGIELLARLELLKASTRTQNGAQS